MRRRLDARFPALTQVRRHGAALSIILAAHLGVLLWMGSQRSPPGPIGETYINLMLSGAPGGPSVEALSKRGSEAAQEQTKGAESSTDDVEAERREVETPPVGADATAPIEPLEAAAEASSKEADVLAMVEALTGTTAEAVAEAPATASAMSADDLALVQSLAGSGGGCDINLLMEVALAADPLAQAALMQVPRDARSVANAIQLWDGDWTPIIAEGQGGLLDPVRNLISAAVAGAPADCRNRLVEGPRFLIVADPGGSTTVLVLGSGLWRWSQLMTPERPPLFGWFGLRKR